MGSKSEPIEAFLKSLKVERNFSPYTIKNYRIDLLALFDFLEGQQIFSLKKEAARKFLYYLEEKKFSRRSLARKISTCRSFFNWLLREKKTEANPFMLISTPKLERKLPEFLYKDETEKLFSAFKTDRPLDIRDKAIIELLYGSGIRLSEAIKLNISGLDLGSGEVKVLGKGSKERITLIGGKAKMAIQNYLLNVRPKLLIDGTKAVFLNKNGGRITQRSVERMLKKWIKRAGIIKKVTPHTLRHSFATHLLDNGADLRSVQELLGHTSLSTTQVYTHITKEKMKSVYNDSHPRAKRNKTSSVI